MTITIPGYSTITGSPVVILRVMQDARIFDSLRGDDYINEVKSTVKRCFGFRLRVTGDTYAERADSLLHEMAKYDLITITED